MDITRTTAALAAALFIAASLAGCSGGKSGDPAFEKVARQKCTSCHGARWEDKTYTAEGWKAVMDDMVRRGARLSDEEYRILVGKGPVK